MYICVYMWSCMWIQLAVWGSWLLLFNFSLLRSLGSPGAKGEIRQGQGQTKHSAPDWPDCAWAWVWAGMTMPCWSIWTLEVWWFELAASSYRVMVCFPLLWKFQRLTKPNIYVQNFLKYSESSWCGSCRPQFLMMWFRVGWWSTRWRESGHFWHVCDMCGYHSKSCEFKSTFLACTTQAGLGLLIALGGAGWLLPCNVNTRAQAGGRKKKRVPYFFSTWVKFEKQWICIASLSTSLLLQNPKPMVPSKQWASHRRCCVHLTADILPPEADGLGRNSDDLSAFKGMQATGCHDLNRFWS